jgi:hypothetical protein
MPSFVFAPARERRRFARRARRRFMRCRCARTFGGGTFALGFGAWPPATAMSGPSAAGAFFEAARP